MTELGVCIQIDHLMVIVSVMVSLTQKNSNGTSSSCTHLKQTTGLSAKFE